jgi:hypothetical protein
MGFSYGDFAGLANPIVASFYLSDQVSHPQGVREARVCKTLIMGFS